MDEAIEANDELKVGEARTVAICKCALLFAWWLEVGLGVAECCLGLWRIDCKLRRGLYVQIERLVWRT